MSQHTLRIGRIEQNSAGGKHPATIFQPDDHFFAAFRFERNVQQPVDIRIFDVLLQPTFGIQSVFTDSTQQGFLIKIGYFPINQITDGIIQSPFEENNDAGSQNNGVIIFIAGHPIPVKEVEEQTGKYIQNKNP